MSGVVQRYWNASTLQGRRWMMQRRMEAVEENDVKALQQLLSGQDRCKLRELTVALEMAISKHSDQYAECVDLLLSHGANPDGTNGEGTPFACLVAEAGTPEILRILLDHKCVLDRTRGTDATALHRAAWRGHTRCVEILLEAGASVNARDAAERTPLLCAAQAGNLDCVHPLINNGACVNGRDMHGMSVLSWSVYQCNPEMFEVSLPGSSPEVVNSPDPEGRTPLHVTAETNQKTMCMRLLRHYASVDLVDHQGRTAINTAAQNQNVEIVEMLALAGSNVNIEDATKMLPIFYVVSSSEVLQVLLNAGGDPDVQRQDYTTPISLCCSSNYVVSTKLLLQGNANPGLWGSWKQRKHPLQIALYHGFIPVVKQILIACVAMNEDISWVPDYLMDDNFQCQCRMKQSVNQAVSWIRDVTEDSRGPPSLLRLCRYVVRHIMGSRRFWKRAGKLELPNRLIGYVRLIELNEVIKEVQ